MRKVASLTALILALIVIAFVAPALPAQQPATTSDAVRVTVTVRGTKENPNPVLTKDDIVVLQDKDKRPVIDWVPGKDDPAGMDLAVVVDDSVDPSVGTNLSDLAQFVRSQPANARVAIIYATLSTAQTLVNFTSDHEAAAKALRLPLGSFNSPGSVFLALSDLISRWKGTQTRRAILLVSDGIDTFYGISESSPALNPSLQTTINKAQRAGINIYSIFASGGGHFRHSLYLVNNGQSCLSRLADETGGEAFFQGLQTPISFKPFLDEQNDIFGRQYILTFRAAPGKKAGLKRLRLRTEQHGVELQAQDYVWIPAAAQ